jgi:hypothetical protein
VWSAAHASPAATQVPDAQQPLPAHSGAFGQQGWPTMPQSGATQLEPAHTRPPPHGWPSSTQVPLSSQQPELQRCPAQQGEPMSPQATQPRSPHTVLGSAHEPSAQQARPIEPQPTHCEAVLHSVAGAVHAPAQQGCPPPPQLAHAPHAQVPNASPQVSPSEMQRLLTQQPPLMQVLAEQQTSAASPHGTQVPSPSPSHAVDGARQARPAQHGCCAPPQSPGLTPSSGAR